LLLNAPRTPSKVEFTKWVFLIRMETALSTDDSFYDFLPYKYGPFSFVLYREIDELRRSGYVDTESLRVSELLASEARDLFESLPISARRSVEHILCEYGRLSKKALIDGVYERHPWFAQRSQIRSVPSRPLRAPTAVYTAGYEGESVDFFFQKLIRAGVQRIIDVRSNPVSRKYGFSRRTLERLSDKLAIQYCHFRDVGVPSTWRAKLTCYSDYQKVLNMYERRVLPKAGDSCTRISELMQEIPSVLVCYERDPRYCHRNRLALRISDRCGLEVKHL